MDILSVQPGSVEIDILDPATGKPTGIKVEIQSLQSDEVKVVERGIRNVALRSGRNTNTAEKLDKNSLTMLAASITGWTWPKGIELGDIADPPCTTENKMKFLSSHWIAKQIDDWHTDQTAFYKG